MELIIGPRLYSTWSLRPWLVLKRCKADFTVREIDIYSPAGQAELEQISPSRLVPLLNVEGVTVWDSMAISVWCAERYPEVRLWPADPHARWLARSAAVELGEGLMRWTRSATWIEVTVWSSRLATVAGTLCSADARG